MCVHQHEGVWTDSGAPYWGGFQADLNFQAAYAPWQLQHLGTADHWPKSGQLWMAWQGYQARGWQPWPQTSIMCGLR